MFVCVPKTENQEIALNILKELARRAIEKNLLVPNEIHVSFALNSTVQAGTAGQGGVHQGVIEAFELDYHGKALEAYGQDFYDTIVHEFCHVLQFVNYPDKKNGHDSDFYYLMSLMGVTEPKRCHNYDLNKVTGKAKRRQRRWEYTCQCEKPHHIATVTHNKMQKGINRTCNTCDEVIKWTGKEIK